MFQTSEPEEEAAQVNPMGALRSTTARSKRGGKKANDAQANEIAKPSFKKKRTAHRYTKAADTDDEEGEDDDQVYQDNNLNNDNKNNNKSNLVKNSSSFPNEFNSSSSNINNGVPAASASKGSSSSSSSSSANEAQAGGNKFGKYKNTTNNSNAVAVAVVNESQSYLNRRKLQTSSSGKVEHLLNSYEVVYNSSDFELDSKKELVPNESDIGSSSAANSKRNSNVTADEATSQSQDHKSLSNMSKELSSTSSAINEKAPFLDLELADKSTDRTSSANYRKNLLIFENNLSGGGGGGTTTTTTNSSHKESSGPDSASRSNTNTNANASASAGAAKNHGAAASGARNSKAPERSNNANKLGNNGKRKTSKAIYMDKGGGVDERHSSTLIDLHGLDANTTTRESQLANLNNVQTCDSLSTLSDKKKKVIVRIVTVFSVVFFLICFAMIAFTLRMSEKIDAQSKSWLA